MFLFSLNKFLYILKRNLINRAAKELPFEKYEVISKFKMEGNVRFDILESKDVLILSEDISKIVKFYRLSEILAEEQKQSDISLFSVPICQ